jgi:aspartyl-tRNA(Asn)/glutamyl-tRNA(Gln) amidotransferase subunit A
MAAAALGTDTGGSCRIPAALNGIAGFKLTAAAVPMGGAFPLSTSLDGVGPLAPTARCCAIVHSVLAGKPAVLDAQVLLGSLRLAIQQTVVLDGLDAHVASCFFASVSRFSAAGAAVLELPLKQFGELAAGNSKGGLTASEAYAAQKERLRLQGDQFLRSVISATDSSPLNRTAVYAALR